MPWILAALALAFFGLRRSSSAAVTARAPTSTLTLAPGANGAHALRLGDVLEVIAPPSLVAGSLAVSWTPEALLVLEDEQPAPTTLLFDAAKAGTCAVVFSWTTPAGASQTSTFSVVVS